MRAMIERTYRHLDHSSRTTVHLTQPGDSFCWQVKHATTLRDLARLQSKLSPLGSDDHKQSLVDERADHLLQVQLEQLRSIKDAKTFVLLSTAVLAAWQRWKSAFPLCAHTAATVIPQMAHRCFSNVSLTNNKR